MRTVTWARAIVAACAIALCACADRAGQNVAGQTHEYRCSDGYQFVVRFEPQRAWIFVADSVKSAPQVPTRSGLHYTNGAISFKKEGTEARLRVGGAEHSGCVNQRQ